MTEWIKLVAAGEGPPLFVRASQVVAVSFPERSPYKGAYVHIAGYADSPFHTGNTLSELRSALGSVDPAPPEPPVGGIR